MALSISNVFTQFGYENQSKHYVREGADAFYSGNSNNLGHRDFTSPFSCLSLVFFGGGGCSFPCFARFAKA